MIIDIERVLGMQKERAAINEVPLNEIEWYWKGVKVEIHQKVIDKFEFTGLNNLDFITSGFYKGPFLD